MTNDTIVVLTTAVCHLPLLRAVHSPDTTHLAGLGILIARSEPTGWSFNLSALATSASEGEAPLLEWALSLLPDGGKVAGWRLAEDVVAPLLSAAQSVEPELSQAFLQRLFALVTAPSDDLALDHGGASAAPLGQHLLSLGLGGQPLTATQLEQAWTSARAAPILAQLKNEATALLHLWSMRSPERAELRVAMGRWIADQRAAGLLP
jgi:hypothetical protein